MFVHIRYFYSFKSIDMWALFFILNLQSDITWIIYRHENGIVNFNTMSSVAVEFYLVYVNDRVHENLINYCISVGLNSFHSRTIWFLNLITYMSKMYKMISIICYSPDRINMNLFLPYCTTFFHFKCPSILK